MTDLIQSFPDGHWESELLAVLLRAADPLPAGLRWLTAPGEPLQLATARHPAGHVIAAHEHPTLPREARRTQEAVLVRKGALRADFYDRSRRKVATRVLGPGDVLLLVAGGHGFEAVGEVELVEFKVGPHLGAADKVRFGAGPG